MSGSRGVFFVFFCFFLSKDLITMAVKTCGTYPYFRHRLSCSIIGASVKEKTLLSRQVGMGSNRPVLY